MEIISLKNFLLSHSIIDESFILDFFDIKNNYHKKEYHPFIINLEIVSNWLGTTKNKLKIN